MADDLKLYLSQLDIDGQLYELKDAEARASLAELNQTIIDNEQVTAAALNDLESRKAEKTDIPTKVSDLTNDVPFATKAQLDTLAETVSGLDASTLAELQKIIAELEDSENGNAWITAIDKLAGLNINYTQAEADAYNANLTGAISTETSLSADQAATLNGLAGVSSTEYTEGTSPTAEDAALYNATLEGAKSTSSTKTPRTVKQYVDAAVAALEAADTALNNAKVNKADIEEVAISQDAFTVVNEKLMISTSTLNVLRNKVVTP